MDKFKPFVVVTLARDRDRSLDIKKAIGINLYKLAYEPINYPGADSDALDRMLCTAEAKIRTITKSRKETAEYISNAITRALLDHMSREDTIRGYPISWPKE